MLVNVMLDANGKFALGVYNTESNRLTLLAGSEITEPRTRFTERTLRIYKEAVRKGNVIDGCITKNLTFPNPATASACVIGYEGWGTAKWTTSSGKTIADLKKELN